MKIFLSFHAKKRMIERRIRLENIHETIALPDYVISKDNKKEAFKKIENKTLKVIYLEEDKYIKVVTLMWK